MGAIWAFIVCVLTVWLAKGSCLPVGGTNKRNDHGLQRTMEDVSPSELLLKKATALLQAMESILEQDAKEVQLETNDVEAESSVGHVRLVKTLNRPKQLKTEDVPVHTAGDSFSFTFIVAGNGEGNGGIVAGNGEENGGIFAGNGGIAAGKANGGIFAGNGGIAAGKANGGIFAGNGIGNTGVVAGNGEGNGGIVAGNGGIFAGNGGGNFLAGFGNFLSSLGNFAGDSSGSNSSSISNNGSRRAADGGSYSSGIFVVPYKGSLPEARGHMKVGQKLQNKAKAESSLL